MRRMVMAAGAAFCVGGGFVLGEFVRGVRPISYLGRPLLAAAVLAILVGLVATLLQRWAVVAAMFVVAWIMQPESVIALFVSGLTAALLGYRLWSGRAPRADGPLLLAAVVFFAAGVIPVVPMMSWSTPAVADVSADGPPEYVILLDGYPRADTLSENGFDISPFIEALEDRGFDHYPEATSRHTFTHQTLSAMTGAPIANEESLEGQRAARGAWRLPDGFAVIAPPIGLATIPHSRVLNRGGFTYFESLILGRSLLSLVAGDWVIEGHRSQLDRAWDVLATTDERRVFAHVFAPHFPVLYDAAGEPQEALDCWPACATVDPRPPHVPVDERMQLIGGYVHWLNGQLIDTVDAILARHPDAEIVVFSDHGARSDPDDADEWRRVFLAARTSSTGLFADAPHPSSIFSRLDVGH